MFIVFLFQLEGDIARKIETISNFKTAYKLTLQPQIVIIGNIQNIEKIFVFINNVKYLAKSFISALDMCFKAIMALDCQYNFESATIFEFLQKYFYEIDHQCDPNFKSVINLISSLK